MSLLMAFFPFIAFVVIERLVSVQAGLAAGAIVAAALLVRDLLTPGRHVKLLEIGNALLFSILTVCALTNYLQWSIAAVRLRVDAGPMLIVLASIAPRQPFTLQYARDTIDHEHWDDADFMQIHYVISTAWALAFGALVLADILMVCVPAVPHSTGAIATVTALVAAVKFT
jgi:hypothetical protein